MIVLDMDSSESPTHGDQEGSAYNGHFGCTCYHPRFCFNQFGDLERCALRTGNVHSADGWRKIRGLLGDRLQMNGGSGARGRLHGQVGLSCREILVMAGALERSCIPVRSAFTGWSRSRLRPHLALRL